MRERVIGPIEIRPGEFKSFEACLKRFRKMVEKEGLLKAVVERSHGYKKPSQKRHEKRRRQKLLNSYNKGKDRPSRHHIDEILLYSR